LESSVNFVGDLIDLLADFFKVVFRAGLRELNGCGELTVVNIIFLSHAPLSCIIAKSFDCEHVRFLLFRFFVFASLEEISVSQRKSCERLLFFSFLVVFFLFKCIVIRLLKMRNAVLLLGIDSIGIEQVRAKILTRDVLSILGVVILKLSVNAGAEDDIRSHIKFRSVFMSVVNHSLLEFLDIESVFSLEHKLGVLIDRTEINDVFI
jgi:hypothetical protein